MLLHSYVAMVKHFDRFEPGSNCYSLHEMAQTDQNALPFNAGMQQHISKFSNTTSTVKPTKVNTSNK